MSQIRGQTSETTRTSWPWRWPPTPSVPRFSRGSWEAVSAAASRGQPHNIHSLKKKNKYQKSRPLRKHNNTLLPELCSSAGWHWEENNKRWGGKQRFQFINEQTADLMQPSCLRNWSWNTVFEWMLQDCIKTYHRIFMPSGVMSMFQFIGACQTYACLVLCGDVVCVSFQTSPAHTATLRSIWTTRTRTEPCAKHHHMSSVGFGGVVELGEI